MQTNGHFYRGPAGQKKVNKMKNDTCEVGMEKKKFHQSVKHSQLSCFTFTMSTISSLHLYEKSGTKFTIRSHSKHQTAYVALQTTAQKVVVTCDIN